MAELSSNPYPRGTSPSSLSLREKTLKKRRINKEHSSNFRAGYVHINEEYLHKTGMRGRKRYFFCGTMVVMTLIAVINLLITFTILGSLRIGREGMETIEMIPWGRLVRFLEDSDMGNPVVPLENTILSLPDREINITGINNNPVNLRLRQNHNNTVGNSVSVSPHATTVTVKDSFEVTDPQTGKEVFSTNFDSFKFPDEMNSLDVEQVTARRVTSGIDKDLRLQSDRDVTVKGGEGLEVKSSQMTLVSKRDIDLTSDQDIVLESGSGIYFEQARQLAYAAINEDKDPSVDSYKVCVCMPSGKLFAVPATLHCDEANEEQNPCEAGNS